MNNISFRQLEAFRSLMLGKTITRAAEMLFISQPAVTRLIHDLESAVGFALFERRKKRLYPTPEAWALYNIVDRSFIGLDKISSMAKEIKNHQSGSLSIASLPALGLSFLPGLISEYAQDRPDVSLSLQIRSSQKVSELVSMQRVDVGFTEATDFDVGVEAELLLATKRVCVLPPGHHLGEKAVIKAEDLDGEPFVVSSGWQTSKTDLEYFFEKLNVKRKVQIDTELFASVGHFVLAGMGISVIDPINAEYFAKQGIIVKPFEPVIEYNYYVTYPEGRPRSRLSDEFVTLLRDHLKRFEHKKS